MARSPKPVRVLADANVLVKDVVSAVLFDLSKAGLISLHWTPEIEVEYIGHRARIRAERNGHAIQFGDIVWATGRMARHKRYLVPDATPSGWVAEETLANLLAEHHYAALEAIADPGDVHVAMAAAFMAEQAGLTVVLATHDLGDFPHVAMAPFNVVVLHPGVLLQMLYMNTPKKVAASLRKTCRDFTRPIIPLGQFLESISGRNQFDNPALADALQRDWTPFL